MFVIWGIGTRRQYTNVLVKDTCSECGTTQNMNILTQYGCGTLFFIPIIKVNRKYFEVCPNCGAGKQITKKEFKQIKENSKNGLVYEATDVTITTEPTLGIENSAKEEIVSSDKAITAEIDSLVKKLQEKNYVITAEKLGKFKPILKEQLMKKFNNEKDVDIAIEEYFKDMK